MICWGANKKKNELSIKLIARCLTTDVRMEENLVIGVLVSGLVRGGKGVCTSVWRVAVRKFKVNGVQ